MMGLKQKENGDLYSLCFIIIPDRCSIFNPSSSSSSLLPSSSLIRITSEKTPPANPIKKWSERGEEGEDTVDQKTMNQE
ncbi:unnamed protein product [Caenorhabditis nigoni]